MTPKIKIVAVTYCADRAGRTRLAYAADLAKLANARLLVLLQFSSDTDPTAEDSIRLDAELVPTGSCYSFMIGNAESKFRAMALDPNYSIVAVVTDDEPLFEKHVRIVSKDENRVFRNSEKKEILLPFGPGDAGVRVLEAIQPFAASLGASIRLYHTTWRNDSVASDNVRDHMRPDVLQVFDQLQAKGPFTVSLETASEVDAGINLSALTNGSSFIAMTRGRHVIRGGYMHWVTARSSVPTIIVP
jgi:hypothetical protein